MKQPNFDKLIPLFLANEDFSLTESQYEKSTGGTLPKEIYYLKNRSALSRVAKQYGFFVEIREKIVSLRKIS